jgi:hypothetical protein
LFSTITNSIRDSFTPFNLTAIAVRFRGQGASRAARYGAVAVLVRSMTHATDNNPHTGAMNYNDSFPKIPALAVGIQDADKTCGSNSKRQEQ